jgi:hypothetical protein
MAESRGTLENFPARASVNHGGILRVAAIENGRDNIGK